MTVDIREAEAPALKAECQALVVDSEEVTLLVLADGPRTGITTRCVEPPLSTARERLFKLSAEYFGTDIFGRTLEDL